MKALNIVAQTSISVIRIATSTARHSALLAYELAISADAVMLSASEQARVKLDPSHFKTSIIKDKSYKACRETIRRTDESISAVLNGKMSCEDFVDSILSDVNIAI